MTAHAPLNVGDAHWKLHLNISRDKNDPVTALIIEVCDNLKKLGKIYTYKNGRNDDQEGKGMTVYVGSHDATMAVAKEINQKLQAKGLSLPPPSKNVKFDDMPFDGNAWGRFDINVKVNGVDFHQYGRHGISYTIRDQEQILFSAKLPDDKKPKPKDALNNSYKILEKNYGEYFTGVAEGQTPKWAKWLKDKDALAPSWEAGASKNNKTHPEKEARERETTITAKHKETGKTYKINIKDKDGNAFDREKLAELLEKPEFKKMISGLLKDKIKHKKENVPLTELTGNDAVGPSPGGAKPHSTSSPQPVK